jgi:outer membrane protein OmpA-like peptidoglycan-associated protein
MRRILSSAVLLSLITGAPLVLAAENKTASDSRWYLSAALGYSRVEPKSDCDCYNISDKNDAGFAFAVGYDLSRYVSVEGYYADLGKAEVSNVGGEPIGSVGYRDFGVTALAYFYNQSPQPASPYYFPAIPRQGFSLYGRVGVGAMKNSTSLPYERGNDFHLLLGMGAEYAWPDGFGLRAEFTAYDEDAALLNIGLVKRFGKLPSLGKQQPGIVMKSTVSTAVPRATKRSSKTHALLNLTMPVIHFEPRSDMLDQAAIEQLNRFARDVSRYYKLGFVIKGYTAASGDEYDNLRLSLSRAMKVKNFLITKGISPRRLSSQGLGSNDPVGDNKTEAGRRVNHRVEFSIR